ncbi:hypothetical protein GOODEAATRI_034547 [Goodea atripinnis]|uniref:Uncharacterized protein n=1 Tax=Goodea atripinnis TaxID=208336 RepID=A0ABV0MZI7_9TELE
MMKMLLPSSCLRFSPPQNHNVTAGTSQTDQAQNAKELMKWVQQQEEMLQALYGEEVELSPSPLLLEEMEECFRETDWAAMDFVPGRSRSSPARSSSKRGRSHRKCSTPAAAAPSELVTPSAVSPQLTSAAAPAKLATPTAASTQPESAAAPAELATPTAAPPQLTLAEPPAEPSSPPPAAARFPAGFSSCPGRRGRRRAAATGKVRVDASYASMEGPPTTASLRLFSPPWVQSGPETPQSELNCCWGKTGTFIPRQFCASRRRGCVD